MSKEKIFIGADSAGFEMKNALCEHLREAGYEVTDCGCFSAASCHYPEFAEVVCKNVQEAPDAHFGILVCGTGIGMSIAANKHRGIRAALCNEAESTAMTRHHNNSNVLCLGARMIPFETALELTKVFLSTEFDGGRHERRVKMLDNLL